MDWLKPGFIRVSPCPLRTLLTWKPATRPSQGARRTVPRVPQPSETNVSRALAGAKSGASRLHRWLGILDDVLQDADNLAEIVDVVFLQVHCDGGIFQPEKFPRTARRHDARNHRNRTALLLVVQRHCVHLGDALP